eukprot:gene10040-11065_t
MAASYNLTANITTTLQSILISTTKRKPIEMTGNSKEIETTRIIIYTLIIIVSFLGNGMLLLTMMFTQRMRTTTNYFLLNMAIGDLLVAVICAPYQLASWKYPSIKTYNQHICKSMPFVQMSTIGVSIFTMLAMAVDRYIAVMYPLKRRMTKGTHILVIIAVWTATIATAAPMLFVYEVKSFTTNNSNGIGIRSGIGNSTGIGNSSSNGSGVGNGNGGVNSSKTLETLKICGEFGWSDPQRDGALYTYALFILQYALPGIIMAYLYLGVFLNLWFHKFPGMDQMSKQNLQKFRKKHYRRKKTVIMLLSMFLVFMVCFLPMHVMSFIFYVSGSSFKPPPYMQLVAMCAEMIMYSNSALNPIVYGFLHEKFKACARGILRWFFCGGQRPNYDNILLKAPCFKTEPSTSISKMVNQSPKREEAKL